MRKFDILVNGEVAAILEIEVTGQGNTETWCCALRPVGNGGLRVELQAYRPDSEVPALLPTQVTVTTWVPGAPYTVTTPDATVAGPPYTDGIGCTTTGPGVEKQWAESVTADGVVGPGGEATNSGR